MTAVFYYFSPNKRRFYSIFLMHRARADHPAYVTWSHLETQLKATPPSAFAGKYVVPVQVM